MGQAKKPSLNGSRPKQVELKKIRLDGDTQSRNELDQDVIKEYARLMQDGVEFPPLSVVYDGTDFWLYDGYHRRWAAVEAKKKQIKCVVVKGTKDDARWLSYGANVDHGLRRTNDDKAKAVESALKHPFGANRADSKIAQHVGVSVATVGKYRKQLESALQIEKVTEREGVDGKVYKTENIGPKAKESQPIRNVRIYCPDNEIHVFKCGRCVKCGEDGKGNAMPASEPEQPNECAPGKHKWNDEGDCEKCHVARSVAEPPPLPPAELPVKAMFVDLLEHVRQSILLIDQIHNATSKKHGTLHESVMNSLDIAGQDAKKWRGLCK